MLYQIVMEDTGRFARNLGVPAENIMERFGDEPVCVDERTINHDHSPSIITN